MGKVYAEWTAKPHARASWTWLTCQIPGGHGRRRSVFGLDCSLPENKSTLKLSLKGLQRLVPSHLFRLLSKASCTETAPWPVHSSPTKRALYSPAGSWIFSNSLIFIQNGLPTYLCLLKCYGPFRPSPDPASSTKSSRLLHSSLLFLLWHLLVPTHSLLLKFTHTILSCRERVSHFHA